MTMLNFTSNKDIFIAISAVLTDQEMDTLVETGKTDEHFQTLVFNNAPWNLALFFEASSILLECYADDAEKLRKAARHQLVTQSQFNGLGGKLCSLWATGQWPPTN